MEGILKELEVLKIPYKLIKRKLVYTIEEINTLTPLQKLKNVCICKNLFLGYSKKERYIL